MPGMVTSIVSGFRAAFGGSGVVAGSDMDMGGHWRSGYQPGVATRSGESVSEDKAMTVPAIFCAVWNLCSHLAMLKLPLLASDALGDKTRLRDDPRDIMFNLEANPEMSAISARSTSIFHAMLWGNSVSEIVRNGRGIPMQWKPLDPDRVRIERRGGRLVYSYMQPDGATITLAAEDVLHIQGMSRDGICGYPLIRLLARENVGLQLALERYAQSFFGNGVSVGTIFKLQQKLSAEAFNEHLGQIRREYAGPENRGKPFLAHGGMEVDRETASNKDAMLVESLTYSIGDVARWFNMPLHILKELSRATFSNIEHLGIEYVKLTLQPWASRIEMEYSRKTLTPAEKGRHKFEHDLNVLLRGDIAARTEFYRLLSERGLSPNDILRLENLNGIGPAGDQHLVQSAMTTLEKLLSDSTRVNGEDGPDPQAEEIAFKREIVKALINDGTIGDVVFNLLKGRELLDQVNLPTTGDEEPWLPVVAASGPLVSGETIEDAQGDVVGGDTVDKSQNVETSKSQNEDGDGGEPPLENAEDVDATGDEPPPAGRGSDGDDVEETPEEEARLLFAEIFADAVIRITKRVSNQKSRKSSKPNDAILADQHPKAVADLGNVVESVARVLRVTDVERIRKAANDMAVCAVADGMGLGVDGGIQFDGLIRSLVD